MTPQNLLLNCHKLWLIGGDFFYSSYKSWEFIFRMINSPLLAIWDGKLRDILRSLKSLSLLRHWSISFSSYWNVWSADLTYLGYIRPWSWWQHFWCKPISFQNLYTATGNVGRRSNAWRDETWRKSPQNSETTWTVINVGIDRVDVIKTIYWNNWRVKKN